MSDSSATEVAFQAFSRLDEVHVEANLSPESKTFLVVGPLAAVKAFIARDGLSLGDANAVVVALAESLTASTDKPKTVETRVMVGDGLKRVVLSALPTACSRHNSPAHPLGTKKAVSGAGVGKSASIVVLVPSLDYAVAAAAAVGRCFPAYNHTGAQLATGATAAPGVDVHVVVRGSEGGEPDAALRARMQAVVRSVRRAAALVDMPTNALHTDSYVAAAEAVMAELGAGASGSVRMETIRGTALRDGGFGGLWGVGKASEHLPALVRLEHVPEGVAPDAESVVLVGKGIVYDTGGLSIKSKTGMPGMAGDMGGSAGILGAFEAIVRTGGCGKRLVALLCLAENSVSKEATRPDDILHMYSGLTVEINNTDAEGRLVLADGVAYAVRHLNPGVIVDMATLTGAQGISTGQQHAAIYCNTDELEAKARSAGVVSGDLVFPLPYAPEFFRKEFKSVKADMKNSVKNRANAQSSCAGQFIGNHLGDFADTGRWLHVDMAYPSHAEERGTGYGVSLLFHLVQSL